MSDQQPPAQPPEPAPTYDETQRLQQPQPQGPPAYQSQQPAAGPRFRDRLWGLRAVIAVALASVILGGLGGAAIARVGDHEEGRDGRFGPGQGRFGGPGGPGMPPGHMRRWQRQQGQDGPWNQQQPTPAPPSPSASG